MTYLQPTITHPGFQSTGQQTNKLGHGLIWLTMVTSGFVLFEPAPYDVLMLGTIAVFFMTGMTISWRLIPLIILLAAYVAGGFFASIVPINFMPTGVNVLITGYLILSSIFIASYIAQDPYRNFERIMNGWSVAACYAALSGILGYFHLAGPASEFLTIHERARGTFEDPNVLGPFLIAPLLYAISKLLRGSAKSYLWAVPMIPLLSLGLLLAFSRGAWGHAILSGIIFGYFLFISAQNIHERFKLISFGFMGIVMIGMLGIWTISFNSVGDLFERRAAVTQNYDSGPGGRFARHILALDLILDNPAGLGSQGFEDVFPEAPHNVYINIFVITGWTGGAVYLIVVLCTIFVGLKQVFVKVPWQNYYIILYATYLGVAMEGMLIDTDHWRHYFLLMGLVWGGAIAPGGFLSKRPTTARQQMTVS